MKNFILVSVTVTLLTSCSWIFGKDKNELQPSLAGAPRTPVNQNYTQQQQIPAMGQPGAEVFINQTPGVGNLPQATPGAMPDFMTVNQPQMTAQPGQMQMGMPTTIGMAPQPQMPPMMPQQPVMQQMAAPAVMPLAVMAPTPIIDQAIVQISKTRNLPASLMPAYNNPLNYEGMPIAQSMPAIVQADTIPNLQAMDGPTMPVEEMQVIPQPAR